MYPRARYITHISVRFNSIVLTTQGALWNPAFFTILPTVAFVTARPDFKWQPHDVTLFFNATRKHDRHILQFFFLSSNLGGPTQGSNGIKPLLHSVTFQPHVSGFGKPTWDDVP